MFSPATTTAHIRGFCLSFYLLFHALGSFTSLSLFVLCGSSSSLCSRCRHNVVDRANRNIIVKMDELLRLLTVTLHTVRSLNRVMVVDGQPSVVIYEYTHEGTWGRERGDACRFNILNSSNTRASQLNYHCYYLLIIHIGSKLEWLRKLWYR